MFAAAETLQDSKGFAEIGGLSDECAIKCDEGVSAEHDRFRMTRAAAIALRAALPVVSSRTVRERLAISATFGSDHFKLKTSFGEQLLPARRTRGENKPRNRPATARSKRDISALPSAPRKSQGLRQLALCSQRKTPRAGF